LKAEALGFMLIPISSKIAVDEEARGHSSKLLGWKFSKFFDFSQEFA
jgi:hypothetical protein